MLGIIPAAGKGTRLKPMTDFIPKEMFLYGPKPFIGYCLDSMHFVGLKKVIVIVGHKKTSIIDYVKDGTAFGVNVDYAYQQQQNGLADAIYSASGHIKKEKDLFIILGDNIINPYSELSELKKLYEKSNVFASILVEPVKNPERFGVVKFKDFNGRFGEVSELFEKPNINERKRFAIDGAYFAISGVYIISSGILNYIKNTKNGRNNEIQLTDALQNALSDGKKIIAMKLNGKRVDIGTPLDYLKEQYSYYTSKSLEDIEKLSLEWK